jgi:hypothetical protein
MILTLDVASWFFIGSAFNMDHVPIWKHLSNLRRLRAIGMDVFCGVVGLFVTVMLIKVAEFEAATRRLLRDYWQLASENDGSGSNEVRVI